MEEKDLKQIGEVLDKGFEKNFDKAFTKAFTNVWENNLEPAFDALGERIDIVQTKLDKALYREFQRIDILERDMKVVKEKLGIPR